MSSAAIRYAPDLDLDAFLAFLDRRPGERWELHHGVPRAMVGGTAAHALIARNISSALAGPARIRGCIAIGNFLVEVTTSTSYEPDAVVVCGGVDLQARVTDRPTIVFEVLSPLTMDFDRSAKAAGYRSVPSLQQIVFVYQDSVRVESWLRQDGQWSARPQILTERNASLTLPALAAFLPLDEVYADVAPSPLID